MPWVTGMPFFGNAYPKTGAFFQSRWQKRQIKAKLDESFSAEFKGAVFKKRLNLGARGRLGAHGRQKTISDRSGFCTIKRS